MDAKDLVPKFIEHLTLPPGKPVRPFILGVIGNIGSGKTTVARALSARLAGTVHMQANSARYLLKEAGMEWGENVAVIMNGVIRDCIGQGYAIILDGASADPIDRQRLDVLAGELGVPLVFVRVRCETEICAMRTKKKYDDPAWESSFDDFRVNTSDKMVANVHERAALHHNLDPKSIPNLEEVDANVSPEDMERHIIEVVEAIQKKLQ